MLQLRSWIRPFALAVAATMVPGVVALRGLQDPQSGDAAPAATASAGADRAAVVRAGLDAGRIVIGPDHEALARALRDRLGKGDRVLVKGSRAARMERVIELLEEVAP